MDGGQFRTPRPADRRVVNGSESPLPYRQPEVPSAPAREERAEAPVAQPVARASRHVETKPAPTITKAKRSWPRRLIVGGVISAAIILTGFAGWLFATTAAPHVIADVGIDKGKYQAVFFTNGLVYYGKLSSVDAQYLKLADVYYIQSQSSTPSQTDTKTSASDTTQSKLIKMGSEVYGPEDELTIARNQVLYYTNLKSDSKVVQLIKNYEK